MYAHRSPTTHGSSFSIKVCFSCRLILFYLIVNKRFSLRLLVLEIPIGITNYISDFIIILNLIMSQRRLGENSQSEDGEDSDNNLAPETFTTNGVTFTMRNF